MDDLLRLCDLSYAESWRAQVRWSDGELAEHGDLLLGAAPTRSPAFNAAMWTGAEPAPDPDALLARATAFFAARDRGFLLHTRAHVDAALEAAARAAGWAAVASEPVMVLDAAPAPGAVAIEVATDVDGAAALGSVVAEAYTAYELPSAVVGKIFARPARVLDPHRVVALARDGAHAVGAGLLVLGHGVAGIYWVGTRAAAQRRGIADALVRHLARIGFERGAAAVILQASPQGRPVYERIGFREVTRYTRFFAPRPRDTLQAG